MSHRLKIKAALLGALVVVVLAAMGFVLATMQDGISLSNYKADMQREMEELPTLLDTAAEETATNTQTFDDIYRSKAADVAFMANNDTGFAATDAKMRQYQELLDVDNVMVVERGGKVVAQAQKTPADFSFERYNQLRTVFKSGEPSEAVESSSRKGARRFAITPRASTARWSCISPPSVRGRLSASSCVPSASTTRKRKWAKTSATRTARRSSELRRICGAVRDKSPAGVECDGFVALDVVLGGRNRRTRCTLVIVASHSTHVGV